MIYFSLGDLFSGILLSSIFGILCAILYFFMNKATCYCRIFLKSIFVINKKGYEIKNRINECVKTVNKEYRETNLRTEFINFLHIVISSFGYCLLTYIAFDGIFRLFSFAVALTVFFVAKKITFKVSEKTFDVVYFYFVYVVMIFLHVASLPLFILYKKIIKRFVSYKIDKVVSAIRLKRAKKVKNKKYKEILTFFTSLNNRTHLL